MGLCSFKRAGQPGPLTRLLSCSDEKAKAYKWLDIVPTFVVPDVEFDEEHNDRYTAYNKPFAVAAWLRVRPYSSLRPCTCLDISACIHLDCRYGSL